MLLNTVIVSLSSILPICIFLVLVKLLCKESKLEFKWVLLGLFLGIFINLIIINTAPYISTWFDYNAMEYLTILLYCFFYLSILNLLFRVHQRDDIWGVTLILSACFSMLLYGSHFLIYVIGYWQQNLSINGLLIGSSLGFGVCISFSVLFFFSINYLIKRFKIIILYLLLLLHASGQLIPAINLAGQVDLISLNPPFWDSSWLIKESSEIGRLIKALFGYEAKPSFLEISIYVFSTLLPLTYLIFTTRVNKQNSIHINKVQNEKY